MEKLKIRIWDGKDMLYFDSVNEWDVSDYNEISKLTRDNKPTMLYTGIRNEAGIELYEGDILYCKNRNHWFKIFKVPGGFAVNTHQDDFKKEHVMFYEGLSDMQNYSWIQPLELMGNIYQHNILLK